MFRRFIEETFPELEYDSYNNRLLDHDKKNCFLVCFLDSNTDISSIDFKNQLNTVFYEDYSIIGIVVLNMTDSIKVEIIYDKVLIFLNKKEDLCEIFKIIKNNIDLLFLKNNMDNECLSLPSGYGELNIIKKNSMETINKIDRLLSLHFKTLLESPKEQLYRDILFSNKIDKKKLLVKYSEYKSEILDIKTTTLKAKEYFKYKNHDHCN
jgi:hypothetical protein